MSKETAPSEFEGRLAPGKDWREIVAWVGDLPPMPHVASRAISMIEDPDTTADELSDLLSSDTALAARTLKIANSAMFSRQREITTLNQAIMLIGFKTLKGIIVAATLRQINKSFGDLEKKVWENSMCTAMCATLLAKRLKKRYVEEVFLLGLLRSLGQIVLLAQPDTKKDYLKVIKLIKEDNIDYVTAEQETYGFAHPLIGALVAKKWNFSAETCQVILHYKDPIETSRPENETDEKTALIGCADLFSHFVEIGSQPDYPKEGDKIKELLRYLGVPEKELDVTIEEIAEKTKEQFSNESQAYS